MTMSDATPNAPAATAPAPAAAKARGPALQALGVAAKWTGLVAAAYAAAAALALVVPEDGDYQYAAVIQLAKLQEPAPKKIVLVGGSNLAFGIDSPSIEAATGCPVANMGINGYLGVRYMLRQAESNVHDGDIVVLAFEYDSFFKSVDGTSTDQLVVVKAAPQTLDYYTWRQKLAMAGAIPHVAQMKLLRLLGQVYDGITDPAAEPSIMRDIETVKGVTPNGDLVSHLGVAWPYDLEDGLDATALPVDPEIFDLLQDFATRMQARGVHVLMSYSPALRSYYDRHQASLDHLQELVAEHPPLAAPSPPNTYVYDQNMFFDTVYHLNADGRPVRTRQLIQDLQTQFKDDATCSVQPLGVANNSGD
jgi:hypothetical protein